MGIQGSDLHAFGARLDDARRAADDASTASERLEAYARLLSELEQVKSQVGLATTLGEPPTLIPPSPRDPATSAAPLPNIGLSPLAADTVTAGPAPAGSPSTPVASTARASVPEPFEYAMQPLRESFRDQSPEDDRITPVPIGHGPNIKPAYDFRRYPDTPVGPVTVAGVKVHITADDGVSPENVDMAWERAQRAADLEFNHGTQLLSGDVLVVDPVRTPDPAAADMHIHIGDTSRQWNPGDVTRQLRKQLGLPPEPSHQGLSSGEIRQLSNDIAKANTPFTRDDVVTTRVFGPGALQPVADLADQHAVEDALRHGNAFLIGADPRTNGYGKLINAGGTSQPGRNIACADAALAGLSSFYGRPLVSAPRWLDRLPDGSIDIRRGEKDGNTRLRQWAGGPWEGYTDGRPIADQFQALHDWIKHLGPGWSAVAHNEWQARDPRTNAPLFNPDGTPQRESGHATTLVYPYGATGPVWWDPQSGVAVDSPPPSMVQNSALLAFIRIDPHGKSVQPAASPQHGADT
jgi:hypothetical protein